MSKVTLEKSFFLYVEYPSKDVWTYWSNHESLERAVGASKDVRDLDEDAYKNFKIVDIADGRVYYLSGDETTLPTLTEMRLSSAVDDFSDMMIKEDSALYTFHHTDGFRYTINVEREPLTEKPQ